MVLVNIMREKDWNCQREKVCFRMSASFLGACRLKKKKQLPPNEVFWMSLNGESISIEDYKHTQNVWREFEMNTIQYHHNLYSVSNVLLIANVFENFGRLCMKNYYLDPSWHFTGLGLACDAVLNKTNVVLEISSDSHT